MKIAIIGIGKVGSSVAFALLFHPKVKEILINDIDENKLAGEVEDLKQAANIMKKKIIISASTINYMDKSDYIFICLGKARHSSKESTDALFDNNFPLVRKAIFGLPKDKVYILTNPTERIAEVLGVKYCGKIMDKVRKQTKAMTGGQIIDRKGNTCFGIASEAWRIVR